MAVRPHLLVCTQHRDGGGKPACGDRGGSAVLEATQAALAARGGGARVTGSACLGPCFDGPNAVAYPDGTWYGGLDASDGAALANALRGGDGPHAKRLPAPDEERDAPALRGATAGGGHGRRDAWCLDADAIYLNHGTVGALPRAVHARAQALRDEMEAHPSRFLLREVVPMVGQGAAPGGPGRLRAAARAIAAYVGAPADELAFAGNATAAIGAVLRAQRLAPGDEVLVLDHAYGAIAMAAEHVAREAGAAVTRARVPVPLTSDAAMVDALDAALTPRTRLAILDHVTSGTALVLPIAALVRTCHARGVRVLVDGAHAPGAVELDLAALGADYYAANLHKWAWAPRSCAFLHARREHHAGLHGPVWSWGLGAGLAAEFDWPGTFDPTPMLAAPFAIERRAEVGETALRAHSNDVAWRAGQALVEQVGARLLVGGPDARTRVGPMITVGLPARFGTDGTAAAALRDRLLAEHRIEVHVQAWGGEVQLRVCGAPYVDDDDVAVLVAALRA